MVRSSCFSALRIGAVGMRQPAQRLLVIILLCCSGAIRAADPPRTTAETSDYTATSTHAEVIAFCDALAKQSSRVRLDTLGTTQEGRKLPLVIVAEPPVASAAEAAKSG